MLRLSQQLVGQLRATGTIAAAQTRLYALDTLPISRPAEVKPFDPNGPLSQLETYLEEDSSLLSDLKRIISLLSEMDRKAQETKKVSSRASGISHLSLLLRNSPCTRAVVPLR